MGRREYIYMSTFFHFEDDGEVKSYNYHICFLFMEKHSPKEKVFEKVLYLIFFNVYCTIIFKKKMIYISICIFPLECVTPSVPTKLRHIPFWDIPTKLSHFHFDKKNKTFNHSYFIPSSILLSLSLFFLLYSSLLLFFAIS